MIRSSKSFNTTNVINLVLNEFNSSSDSLNNSEHGLIIKPSKDVSGRTDITGYVLTSENSTGKVSWSQSTGGGGGGSGTPEGPLHSVQFHDISGQFQGTSNFTWTNSTNTLNVAGLTIENGDVNGLPSSPPTLSSATSKTYVDSLLGSGVFWKDSVRAASTGNVNIGITLNGVTLDGISSPLVINDRVLLFNQTDSSENGLYEVVSGSPQRSSDALNGTQSSGSAVWVNEGTSNGDQAFICNTLTSNFGDNIDFVVFSSGSSFITPSAGSITEIQYNSSGNTFDASSDFTFDNTTKILNIGLTNDNGSIILGNNKSTISHDGLNFLITNTLGNLTIDNGVNDVNISGVKLNNGKIILTESSDDTTETVTIKPPTIVNSSYDLTLPSDVGNDNEVLVTDNSGSLTWKNVNNMYGVTILNSVYTAGSPYIPGANEEYIIVDGSSTSDVHIRLPDISTVGKVTYTIIDKGRVDYNSTTFGIVISVSTGNLLYNPMIGNIPSDSEQYFIDNPYRSCKFINDGVNSWFSIQTQVG